VPVLVYEAPVPGIEPAVHQGLFSGLVILVISQEHGGTLGYDFSLIGNLDLCLGNGGSDRVELHVAVPVDD
jgi:hypothetical protein